MSLSMRALSHREEKSSVNFIMKTAVSLNHSALQPRITSHEHNQILSFFFYLHLIKCRRIFLSSCVQQIVSEKIRKA